MNPTNSTQRIAFSFANGTFNIRRMKPHLWNCDDECGTAHVQLDCGWPRLLPALEKVGLLMACAPSGPVTGAVALHAARFEPVPGSRDWICLKTGMEISTSKLGGVLATLEPLEGGQQSAALQFFDRRGEGCLKLLVTNFSHIEPFEQLVGHHATLQPVSPFGLSGSAASLGSSTEPDAEAVRSLWGGLRRTLPTSTFPGLEGVLRRHALGVAGPQHAWKIRETAILPLLRAMALADAPLGIGLRNEAVFLPMGMQPHYWSGCCCGTTFFAGTSQLTLRDELTQAEAWVTRFKVLGKEILCLEIYDADECFRAGLGLLPEAMPTHHMQWNHWLREAAC